VLPSNDEEALEEFIDETPLTVNICASYSSFIYYKSGVYDDHNCCQKGVDHAVLLVGYGRDKKTNEDYWILQNSWGTSWGENGFIRLKKTSSSSGPGMCHIAYRPAMIFGGKRTSMWSTFDDGTSEIGGGVAAFVGILISIPLLIFGLQKLYHGDDKRKYSSIKDNDSKVDQISPSIVVDSVFNSMETISGNGDGGIISLSTEYQTL